jgi:hypothetical protein
MILKLATHLEKSSKFKVHHNLKSTHTTVMKTSDNDVFVCKQGDKACWQRYTSAMTDCV